MHGKGKRTEAAHARAARASEGHGRALLPCAFLLALVALLLVPTRAYADGGGSHYFGGDTTYKTVLYASEYDGSKQYIVGANSKYDAAAYICGQTATQVASYDDATRYKLSTTENDFSALADSLEKDWPTWNEDSLARSLSETFARIVSGSVVWNVTLWDNMTNPLYQGTLSLFQVGYWQNNVDCDIYAVDTTSEAVSRARDDLQEILNGGGDSGGTTGVQAQYLLHPLDGSKSFWQYQMVDGAPDIQLNLPQAVQDNYTQKLETYKNMYILVKANFTYDTRSSPRYYRTTNISVIFTDGTAQLTENHGVQLPSGGIYTSQQFTDNGVSGSASEFALDGIVTYNFGRTDFSTVSENGYVANEYARNAWYFTGGQGDVEPPSGPGNWPDPPSNPNPEPPTVPDPPQNPEPDPPSTPVAPTPPPLEPPTNVTIPTGTTAADYTPWLRAILEQLQTLTDELATHCVHLQEEMQTSVNELQDTLIYRFNSLENHIWDLFNGLEDYLHDLAEWLAEQLDFNVNTDPYDDTSVLYWLRQIFSRLGNLPRAPTTVIDPDPTEPFDFWAWLMNLIANTVGGIIGDLVGDVAGLLDLFKDKFPFSIPWDIAAMLALLDGTRATPAFDVKLAAVPGWWQETTFRIDLAPFDSVASACRTMVNILWVMVLIMKTDWMLAIMGDATSFGERFARKVTRTS